MEDFEAEHLTDVRASTQAVFANTVDFEGLADKENFECVRWVCLASLILDGLKRPDVTGYA